MIKNVALFILASVLCAAGLRFLHAAADAGGLRGLEFDALGLVLIFISRDLWRVVWRIP